MSPAVPIDPKVSAAPVTSGLKNLFTDDAYSEILEQVLAHLGLRDTARVLRINRHSNEVFTSSSRLQLSYRKFYHSMPSPLKSNSLSSYSSTFHNSKSGANDLPIAEQLKSLLEKEERLDSLTPRSIKCLHVPNSTLFELQSGFLLMGERTHKIPIYKDDPENGYKFDSWSIWKLSNDKDKDGEDSFAKARGGYKHQGFHKWKFDEGQHTWDFASMNVEDNVIAVAREYNEVPCESLPPNSKASTLRRIYFYQLLPSEGTPTPPKGNFHGGIRHPDAALQFIEVKIPAKYHLHRVKIQLAAGGKVGVLLQHPEGGKTGFLGFWDWKQGVSLGLIAPSAHTTVADDFRFIGNFVMAASFRDISNDLLKARLKASKSTSGKSHRTSKKMAQGYKVGKGTSGGGSRQKSNDSLDDSDDDQEPKDSLHACLEIFELFKVSNGRKASPFAHRAYTETGYDPNEHCTWDYQDIPTCSAITSFVLPPFKSGSEIDESPLLAFMSGASRRGLMVVPTACDIGEIIIDDTLLKNERSGVMTINLTATIANLIRVVPLKCQMTIDLRTIIDRITIVLNDRIKYRHLDPRGRTIQTELNTMWSNDPSVQKSLNEHLGLDEDAASTDDQGEEGWESDTIEYFGNEEVYKAMCKLAELNEKAQGKGKTKSKSKGKVEVAPIRNREVSKATMEIIARDSLPNFYKTNWIPWSQWGTSCALKFIRSSKPLAAFGTRVFTVEPNMTKIDKLPQRSTKLPMDLVMTDHNSNSLNELDNPSRSKRPLGRPPYNNTSSAGPNPEEKKSLSESNPTLNLKETIIGECKLPKPINLPKFNRGSFKSIKKPESNSNPKGNVDVSENMFDLEYIMKDERGYTETRIEFEWDGRRLLSEVLFDGDRVVLYMQNGATIMDFSA